MNTKKHQLLYLLLAIFCTGALTIADASAGTVKKPKANRSKTVAAKAASAKSNELTKAQQAEQEAKAQAAQKEAARAEAEARTRAEAEAKARAEAEAKTKREAEIAAREKPLIDAEALMKDGKPAEAYALLEPLDFERSGEARFDYLLGIAALDSGKPDKATLVFERVLAVDPNFAGARLDMARAYYQLGDLPRAKTEFEDVLKQNPPEAVRATIRKYLDTIAAQEQVKQTSFIGYIEGVVGHDSNIANTSTQTMMFSPANPLGLGILFPEGLPPAPRLAGIYRGVNAGGEINHRLNANWGVLGGADFRHHGNTIQTAYDTNSAEGRVGVMYTQERDVYKLSFTGGQVYTADSMHRDTLGLSTEWQHIFNSANQMGAFVQYMQGRATGLVPPLAIMSAQTEGNTDLAVAGAGGAHIFPDGKTALFGSIYFGKEVDVAPPSLDSPDGGRLDGKKQFEGLRVGGTAVLAQDWEGFASAGWQYAIFGKPNKLIDLARRDENQYDLTVGANWHIDKLWIMKPQLAFTSKKSNVTLYGFDRTDISLAIRREFK